MGSKGINTSSVLMCVLMLGLVLEQVHVEAKSCCRNTTARNCYNICHLGSKISQETCAKTCDCKIVPGITSRDQCPEGYRSLTSLPDFEKKLDNIEYCRFGCRSQVCDNMNNVDGSEEIKKYVELCGEGCDRFCNGDSILASVVAA